MTTRVRIRINAVGAVALAVVAAWWFWPRAPLDSRAIGQAIRQELRTEEGARQMAELRDRGLTVPDEATALSWKAHWDTLDAIRVETVEARRCRNPVPLRRDRRVIARAKIVAPGADAATAPWRYFRLRWLYDGSFLAWGETGAWAWHLRM